MLNFMENISCTNAFYLTNAKEFIVGRKNCNFLIENDSSISRSHAKLYIENNMVTIEDLNSKYKTYHNGTELVPKVKVELENKDKIQFGGLNSIFIFRQMNIVTTGTQLSSAQKELLKKQLSIIGGRFVDNWTSECTHLTVEKISLTVKVLHALLEDKPIVVSEYWEKFAEHTSKGIPPPDITKYNDPPLAEVLINKVEFKNVVRRKDLFQGKTFLFASRKERKQVEELILKAGGLTIDWETRPLSLDEITKSSQEFIIMQSTKSVDDTTYDAITKHFSKQKKRTIPTQEIAMAILHGSCEKDCNPSFNRTDEVFRAQKQNKITQHEPLVQNTLSQNLNEEVPSMLHKVIPETLDITLMDILPINKKEIEEDIDCVIVESKNKEKSEEVLKRVCDNADQQKPSKRIRLEEDECTARSVQLIHEEIITHSELQGNDGFLSKDRNIKKRKATDDIKMEISSKRVMSDNIFDIKSNSGGSLVNPFSLIQKPSGYDTISSDNPLLSLRHRKVEENPTVSTNKIEVEKPTPSNIKNEKYPDHLSVLPQTTTDMYSGWFSKSNDGIEKEIEEKEVNTEMQKIVDLFKNSIVVDVLSRHSIRYRKSRDEPDCSIQSDIKNFKKFKKVKPLRPQTTVINKDTFESVYSGDAFAKKHAAAEMAHEPDNEIITDHSKLKRKVKRFDI